MILVGRLRSLTRVEGRVEFAVFGLLPALK